MLTLIHSSFKNHPDRIAFCIGRENYSYRELETITAAIVKRIDEPKWTRKIIAVLAADNIYTYAAILAAWFSGNAFLPLHPKNSLDRNIELMQKAGADVVICTDEKFTTGFHSSGMIVIEPARLAIGSNDLNLPPTLDEKDLMYVLFTSGSTGKPKGVPINRNNLDSFVKAFFRQGYKIDESDRFMQMFDLTFDVSVQSYVLPLCTGASVYTVPENAIKYLYALKLMREKRITITKMVPSTLNFLQSYFDKISLPSLKYSLFSGEGLPVELIKKWQNCVPNAAIHNYYGPTEATIDCTFYSCGKKSYNGIVSIGKAFGDSHCLIINEKGKPVEQGKKAELCVAGSQVFEGYLNNDELTKKAFITLDNKSYYRTGDLVYEDEEGDIMFCGRIDHQVQVQGYRVEPGEIEYAAKKYIPGATFAAVAITNNFGNNEIHLFATKGNWNKIKLLENLKINLPFYMIPVQVHEIDEMPLNPNGKIDRHALIGNIQ